MKAGEGDGAVRVENKDLVRRGERIANKRDGDGKGADEHVLGHCERGPRVRNCMGTRHGCCRRIVINVVVAGVCASSLCRHCVFVSSKSLLLRGALG